MQWMAEAYQDKQGCIDLNMVVRLGSSHHVVAQSRVNSNDYQHYKLLVATFSTDA